MDAFTLTATCASLSSGKPPLLTITNGNNDQEPKPSTSSTTIIEKESPCNRITEFLEELPSLNNSPPLLPSSSFNCPSSSSPSSQLSSNTMKVRKMKTRRKCSDSQVSPPPLNCCLLYILVRKLSSRIMSLSLNRRRRMNNDRLSILVNSTLVLYLVILASSILLFNVTGTQAQAGVFDGMCPDPECYCGLDNKGRLEVACTSGGLKEIPTSRMSPYLEVIRIVAPKGRANQLNIGRFFRNFKKLEELHIVSIKYL